MKSGSAKITDRGPGGLGPMVIVELALAGAPLLTTVAGILLVGLATVGFDPLWSNSEMTLPEAAAMADIVSVSRLVDEGHDPASPAPVPAGLLRSFEVRVSALDAAVAIDSPRVLAILLRPPRVLNAAVYARLTCFARTVGASETRRILAEIHGHPKPPADCSSVNLPW